MSDQSDLDPATMVVVPRRPGPLRHLDGGDGERDELDAVLDDLFGAADARGPSLTDALLVGGGLAVAVAGAVFGSRPALVVGLLALGLGLVLPARAAWQRLRSGRARSDQARALAAGVPLRIDDAELAALVAAHDEVATAAVRCDAAVGERTRAIAHSAVYEVATLLAGRHPDGLAEREYVTTRTAALRELAAALIAARAVEVDGAPAAALVAARREVEEAGGSSVTDAADLVGELRGDDAR